jgi:hypothetical protein
MNKLICKRSLRQCAVLLALCAAMQGAPAQDRKQNHVVQDGIAVKPLEDGVWRKITAPERPSTSSRPSSTRP